MRFCCCWGCSWALYDSASGSGVVAIELAEPSLDGSSDLPTAAGVSLAVLLSPICALGQSGGGTDAKSGGHARFCAGSGDPGRLT